MKTVWLGLLALFVVATHPLRAAEQLPSRWEKDVAAFEAIDKTNPPPAGAVLFIGSSNIRLWKTMEKDFAGIPTIKRGLGGCYLADLPTYADRIVVPYKPKVVVISAGGNDINAKRTPEQVVASFRELTGKIREKLPDVRIIYLSIGPSHARWSQWPTQTAANKLIEAEIKAGANMEYIDIGPLFLGPDGEPNDELFLADKLHPSDKGNALRAALLKPRLEAALAK